MGAIISAIIGAVTGQIGQSVEAVTNMQSEQAAVSVNQANLGSSWAREDTAIQRRVLDLRAAGLSPTLASGTGAQTMSPIQIGAPQLRNTGSDSMPAKILALIAAAKGTAEIKQTEAQTQLTKQLSTKAQVETGHVNTQNRIDLVDAKKAEETGITPSSSREGKVGSDVMHLWNKIKGQTEKMTAPKETDQQKVERIQQEERVQNIYKKYGIE